MTRNLAILFATAALVAACGGGGGDDTPAPAPAPAPVPAPPPAGTVPDSASASVSGFISYLSSLVTSTDDRAEPLDVSAVNPPLTDTAEPSAVP